MLPSTELGNILNFMKNKKANNIVLIIIVVLGLGLISYPSLSNYINQRNATRVISSYMETVSELDNSYKEEMLSIAKEYNQKLATEGIQQASVDNQDNDEYFEILNLSGNGLMGYVSIPILDIRLPIYHGTEESILSIGVGHIEWSSLPVGGTSSHSVISGHRGLPSAKLFTDIDKLAEGDLFFIEVLGEEFAYEVDQINIVTPENIDLLKIEPGRDLCTLVTCTPYGVNTHRLLVRGHRTDASSKAMNVALDATQVKPAFVASVIAIPILLIMFVYVMFKK